MNRVMSLALDAMSSDGSGVLMNKVMSLALDAMSSDGSGVLMNRVMSLVLWWKWSSDEQSDVSGIGCYVL